MIHNEPNEQHERRRGTDPLIEQLIEGQKFTHQEIANFRDDLKPILKFMAQVSVAKTAALWVSALIMGLGALITWALNVKDHLGK